MAITNAKLHDVEQDIDDIMEFATSAAPEMVDRLGTLKQTLKGIIDAINSEIDVTSGQMVVLRDEAAASADEAEAHANAIAATVVGGRRADTWAGANGLSTIAGLPTNSPGEVTLDVGLTHVDPVTAAVVPNQGQYRYVNPTGWQWVGAITSTANDTAANAMADDVQPTVSDGKFYIAAAPNETYLGIDPATGRAFGSAVDLLGVRPTDTLWWDFVRRLDAPLIVYRQGEGWNHSIGHGQSNALGSADSAPVLTPVAAYYNLTFNGGVRADGTVANPWTATKPLGEQVDGINGESSASGFAEAAVAYAVRRMGIAAASNIQFLSVVGAGATALTGLDKPSTVYTRLLDHVTQAKALATAAGKQYNCNIVFVQQGETDALNGVTRAAYLATALQFVDDMNVDIKAIKVPQDDVHTLWSQLSYCATNGVDTNIALAQLDLTHQRSRAHIVAPTYIYPHDEDDTHRTPAGHKLEGSYGGRAAAQLRQGKRPDNLEPTSAYVVNGTELHIRYGFVPNYPLAFDITYRQQVQDFGIKVVDAAGTLVLSGHKISESGNEVIVTLDRALAGNPRCRIGIDYLPWDLAPAGKGITNGALTNIRDSTYDPVVIDGVKYDRAHWSLHAELPIDILIGEQA